MVTMASPLMYPMALIMVINFACCTHGSGVPCNQAYVSHTTHQGVIHSYNYPFDYQDQLTCTYRIYINSSDVIDAWYSGIRSEEKLAHETPSLYDVIRMGELGARLKVTHPDDVISSAVVCLKFYRFQTEDDHDGLEILEGDKVYFYNGDGQEVSSYPGKEHVWLDPLCFHHTDRVVRLTFTSDQSGVRSGFYALFWTELDATHTPPTSKLIQNKKSTSSQLGDVYPNISAPCFGLGQWTCFNRKCILEAETCDSVDSCGDWSDEMYTHATCKTGPYRPSLYGCDFDDGGTCGLLGVAEPGWTMDTDADNPDPERQPSTGHTVGPLSANKQSSAFVRTVFGSVLNNSSKLRLTDNNVELSTNTTYCLSFWYHMCGPRVGRLRVSIQPDVKRSVWSRTANYSARWLHGEVQIKDLENAGKVFFEGIRSLDYYTTFALDDISLKDDKHCYTDDVSCTFEYHLCGWNDVDNNFNHTSRNLPPHGPQSDPVSEEGDEYYIALIATTADKQVSGNLLSPVWGSHGTDDVRYSACLVVWLYSSSAPAGSFYIWTVDLDDKRELMATLKPEHFDKDWLEKSWRQISVNVSAGTPFRVEIEGLIESSDSQVHLAIDDVELIEGTCDLIDLQSCPLGEFMCVGDHSCVEKSRICDGYNDCYDASDESTEACCYAAECNTEEFCCRNQGCIQKEMVCNGYNDCGDWSDEIPCSDECVPGQIPCEGGGHPCIDSTYQCDDQTDCAGGNDEDSCYAILPPAAISSIVVVAAIVIIIVTVRLAICAKHRRGCSCGERTCCRCRQSQEDSDTESNTEDAPDTMYQQPPEYQECVNNPVYRTPKRKVEIDGTIPEAGVLPPPSYDLIEKGAYETIDVTDKSALDRLRRNIMAKSREAFNTSSDSLSTIVALEVSVQAEVMESGLMRRRGLPDATQAARGIVNQSFSSSIEELPAVGLALAAANARNSTSPPDLTPRSLLRHQFQQIRAVRRGPSDVSSVSIPRYSDLTHPPVYECLSLRGEEETGVVMSEHDPRTVALESEPQTPPGPRSHQVSQPERAHPGPLFQRDEDLSDPQLVNGLDAHSCLTSRPERNAESADMESHNIVSEESMVNKEHARGQSQQTPPERNSVLNPKRVPPKTNKKPTPEQIALAIRRDSTQRVPTTSAAADCTENKHKSTKLYRRESKRLRNKIHKQKRRDNVDSTNAARSDSNGHDGNMPHADTRQERQVEDNAVRTSHNEIHCDEADPAPIPRSRPHSKIPQMGEQGPAGPHSEGTPRHHTSTTALSRMQDLQHASSMPNLVESLALAKSMPSLSYIPSRVSHSTSNSTQKMNRANANSPPLMHARSTPYDLNVYNLADISRDANRRKIFLSQGQLQYSDTSV